jgi:hypothetical protein
MAGIGLLARYKIKERKQKMNTQFLTGEGQQQLLSQLEYLRTVKRAEVARYLREAIEAGDVIGNAAFEDAKFEQARLEGRRYSDSRRWTIRTSLPIA